MTPDLPDPTPRAEGLGRRGVDQDGIDRETTMEEQWRLHHRRAVEQSAASGRRDLEQRLRGFGSWQVVTKNTILLVIVEVVASFVLAGLAFVVMFLHGNYLTHGVSLDTAANRAGTDLTHWLTSPVALGLSALVTQGSIFLVLHWCVVRRGLLSWHEIGFGPALRDRPGRAFAIGLGIGLAAFLVGEILLLSMHAVGLPISGQQDALASVHHSQILPFLFFAFTAAITAPIAEESYFRAYAMRAMTVRYGFPVGAGVSSLFFGLLHLTGGVGLVFIPLIVIGVILAWGYARTGNLITNITAHALNNLIGVVLLLTSG
jgi:membrane protease YdiL (CAAX protease family)